MLRHFSPRVVIPVLALVVTSLIAARPALAQPKQVVMVTLSAYDELRGDVQFVGGLMGQPQAAEQMDAMVMLMAQGLPGIDRSRPIGVAVFADGPDLMPVVYIPVSDFGDTLGLVRNLGGDVEKQDDGSYNININRQEMFAKESNGWAVISNQAEGLEVADGDPSTAIAGLNDTYDIGGRIQVQNIPADLRNVAINGLREGIEQGMQQDPNQTAEEFEQSKQMVRMQMKQFEVLLEQADELTFGLSLDSESQQAYIDFISTAVPGTDLARQIEASAKVTTNYSGFNQPDAAMMLSFASDIPDSEIDQATEVFDTLREQIMTQIENEAEIDNDQDRDKIKESIGDFFDAFVDTVKSGKMEGGLVCDLSPAALTVVAGGNCADPDKVVSGLKKLESIVEKEEDFPGVEWNAETHSGISFHKMMVPLPADEEEARSVFGEQLEIAVGTGDGSFYIAVGRGAIEKAKGIIDLNKSKPNAPGTPMQMSVSLGQIMNMVAALQPDPTVEAVAKALSEEAAGKDHVRIFAEAIPNGMKYRILAEQGVFKAIEAATSADSDF